MGGRIYGQAIARNSPEREDRGAVPERQLRPGQPPRVPGGPRRKTSNIVGLESYELGAVDVRQQMARLRATGATILVMFAIPTYAVPAYPIANALRWSPAVIYTSSVAATDTFLTLAKNARAAATSSTRPSPSST